MPMSIKPISDDSSNPHVWPQTNGLFVPLSIPSQLPTKEQVRKPYSLLQDKISRKAASKSPYYFFLF